MDITLQAIQENVAKLLEEHQKLLTVSEQKTTYIKQSEMELLVKELLKEKQIIQVITQLEAEREKLVAPFFQALQIEKEHEKTITHLLKHLKNSPEKERLVEDVTALIETITQLKANEALNGQLLEQSMQFIQLSLNMIEPTAQNLTYGDAKQTTAKMDRSVFDSKA